MNVINKSIKKLGVTGGRDYFDQNRVFREIDEYRKTHVRVDTIVTGDANGTDKSAREYAKARKLNLIVKEADWTDMSEPCFRKTGKNGDYNALAGFKRNTEVVKDSEAMMSFWNKKSPGTKDVITKSKNKQIDVKEIFVNY